MLFAITAAAEIVGCYLPWLVLRQDKLAWLLIPAALAPDRSHGCSHHIRLPRGSAYITVALAKLTGGGMP